MQTVGQATNSGEKEWCRRKFNYLPATLPLLVA
jgi:hypothetical protein